MLANFAKHKAEGESALERLRTDLAGLRTETYRTIVGAALGIVIILGFIITNQDRNSQPPPAPTIIYQQAPSAYQPPAASVLPDPN